jgi:hypothetical protein
MATNPRPTRAFRENPSHSFSDFFERETFNFDDDPPRKGSSEPPPQTHQRLFSFNHLLSALVVLVVSAASVAIEEPANLSEAILWFTIPPLVVLPLLWACSWIYQRRRAARPAASREPERPSLPVILPARPALPPPPRRVFTMTPSNAERELTAQNFTAVVQQGDLSGLLHNFAVERLREFEAGDRPHSTTQIDWPKVTFGFLPAVPPRAEEVSRDMLRSMLEITREATALINATNDFTTAKITAATTQQRAELEHAKLTAALAEQRAIQAEHETRAREAEIAQEVDRRVERDVQSAIEPRLAEVNDLRDAAQEKFEQAGRRLDGAMALADDVMGLIKSFEDLQRDEINRRRVDKPDRVDKRDNEERRHTRARQRLQHAYELEALKTKRQQEQHQQRVDRALLKRRLAGANDPKRARARRAQIDQDRALQNINDQLRAFTDQAERAAYARREVDAYLKRVAEEYGEDSEEYGTAQGQADTFTRKLQDEEDS